MARKTDGQRAGKRPYREPRLKVHGDFRKLTAAKGGSTSDGTGKPATKSGGASS